MNRLAMDVHEENEGALSEIGGLQALQVQNNDNISDITHFIENKLDSHIAALQARINVEISNVMHSIDNRISVINQKISEINVDKNENMWLLASRNGIVFFLDKRSLVDKCIIDQGVWEEQQTEYFVSVVEGCRGDKDLYFFDIGSYFGYYSLIFNQKFPDSHIYAFEANPMTYIQLKTNLLCNNLHDKIVALNSVVCSESGETSVFNHEELMDNRGGWSVNNGSGRESLVKNLVIDEYFHDLRDKFIAMKIDVEGYEAEVLGGLRNILKENKVFLQVECFDFNDELREKFEKSLDGLGLIKINQIQYDHYYVNFGDESLVEKPKDVFVPASKFFTNLNTRNAAGHIAFDNLSGHAFYGPCMWVAQGRKKVVFNFVKGTTLDNCTIEIFSNYAHSNGRNAVFHSQSIDETIYNKDTGELIIYYEHPLAYCDIEFRLFSRGNSRGVFVSANIYPQ